MVILDISRRERRAARPGAATWASLAADIGWTITSYSLIFGSLLLLGGRAADLLGRRRVFLTGLARVHGRVAGVGARRRAPTTLFAARAGQGLGAAMLSPAALSIIMTTFHGAASARRRSASGAPSAAPAPRSACCSAAR